MAPATLGIFRLHWAHKDSFLQGEEVKQTLSSYICGETRGLTLVMGLEEDRVKVACGEAAGGDVALFFSVSEVRESTGPGLRRTSKMNFSRNL